MNGDANSATFTLTPCDDEYQAVLTGPVVINGGKPVPADNWSYFDVDFEIMTPTGLSIVPDDSYIDIYKSPRGTDWTYSFAIASIKVDKTVLAPGESTKVKVNFLYRTVEGEEDLIGSTLYLRVNYFRTPEGYCSLQLGDYEPSMSFSLVSPGSGLVDICDDANGEVRIYSLQGHVVYEGRYDEANLKPGVYVVCRANGTSTKIVVTE